MTLIGDTFMKRATTMTETITGLRDDEELSSSTKKIKNLKMEVSKIILKFESFNE